MPRRALAFRGASPTLRACRTTPTRAPPTRATAHPHRSNINRPVAPVTMVLIAICVSIAILSALTGGSSWTNWLLISERVFSVLVEHPARDGARNSAFCPKCGHGQVWRLFTPVLMHASILGFGILHILFNMFLASRPRHAARSAPSLAGLFSRWSSPSPIGSNLLQYCMKGPFFVGMSGGRLRPAWVTSGCRGRLNPGFGFELNSQTLMFMMVWLVAGFLGMIGPVANYAHLGGLIMGGGHRCDRRVAFRRGRTVLAPA